MPASNKWPSLSLGHIPLCFLSYTSDQWEYISCILSTLLVLLRWHSTAAPQMKPLALFILVSPPDFIRHIYCFQYDAREKRVILKAICAGVGFGSETEIMLTNIVTAIFSFPFSPEEQPRRLTEQEALQIITTGHTILCICHFITWCACLQVCGYTTRSATVPLYLMN